MTGDRLEVFNLMQEAGAIIKRQPDVAKQDAMWAAATDDLADAIVSIDVKVLREQFIEIARSAWAAENVHSVKAPPKLQLVRGGAS